MPLKEVTPPQTDKPWPEAEPGTELEAATPASTPAAEKQLAVPARSPLPEEVEKVMADLWKLQFRPYILAKRKQGAVEATPDDTASDNNSEDAPPDPPEPHPTQEGADRKLTNGPLVRAPTILHLNSRPDEGRSGPRHLTRSFSLLEQGSKAGRVKPPPRDLAKGRVARAKEALLLEEQSRPPTSVSAPTKTGTGQENTAAGTAPSTAPSSAAAAASAAQDPQPEVAEAEEEEGGAAHPTKEEER